MADFYLKTKVGLDTSTIQSDLNKLKPTLTVTTQLSGGGTKEIATFKDELGNTAKVAKEFDAQGKLVSSTLKSVRENTQGASTAIGQLGQDFVTTTGKVLKFGLSTAVIGAFTASIGEAISTVKDFDSALTELQKVQEFTDESLNNFKKDAIDLGVELSRSATDVIDSVTQFKKSGYDLQDSLDLSKSALMMQNTADAMMTSSETASALIAVMKGYNLTAEQSMHITDAINKVSEQYAVSSADLTSNIQKVASTLNAGNTTFEETVGLMTSITEVTRNASQSAMALKTISQRIRGVGEDGEDLGDMVGNLQKAFDDFGISIQIVNKDTQEMASTYDILKAVSEKWYDLTDAQRQYLGEQMAGKLRITQLNALMQNFQTAINATNDALNSTGTTVRQFEVYEQSLEGRTNALIIQFQKFVLGDGGLNSLLKGLVTTGTEILKFANDTNALNISLTAFATIMAIKALPSLISFISTMSTGVGVFALEIAQTKSLSASLEYMGVSATTATTAMNVLIGVIALGAIAWNKYKASQEQARNEAVDALSTFDNTNKSLQNAIKIVNDENTSKKNLISTMSSLIDSYDTEKESLKDINELRQESIKKLYEEAKAKAQETITEQGAQASKGKKFLESSYGKGLSITVNSETTETVKPKEQLEIYKEILDTYEKRIKAGEKLNALEQFQYESATKAYTKLNDEITQYEEIIKGVDDAQKIVDFTLEEWLNTTEDATDSSSNYEKELENLAKTYNTTTDAIKNYMVNNPNATMEESAQAIGNLNEKIKEQDDIWKDFNSNIDSIQSAYKTLTSAVEEYNSTGGYSIDTLQSLLSLGSEYLGMLQLENGQLVLNEQAIIDKANALIEEQKQTVISTAMERLSEVERQNSTEITKSQSSEINTNTESLSKESTELRKNTAEQYANRIARNDKSKGTAVDDIIKDMNLELDALGKLGDSFTKINSTKASSAKSSAKSSSDAWKEAFEKEKDDLEYLYKTGIISAEEYYTKLDELARKYYEGREEYSKEFHKEEEEVYKGLLEVQKKEIEAIKDTMKKALDDLKKEKDKVIDGIDKQISKIKKLKEAETSQIESRISKLKKSRDAEEKYWDDKINALKKQNEQIEKQNKLAEYQESLAKAKATQVMTLGTSGKFEYGENEALVSEAEQNLADYQQQQSYEQQLADLESFKEQSLENYDEQIADLEDYLQRKQENYDAQIAQLEEYKEQQQEQYDAQIEQMEVLIETYDEQQKALLNNQLEGVDKESANWKARLDNLKSFINAYNKMLASLGIAGKKVSYSFNATKANDIVKDIQSRDPIKGYASGVSSVGDNQVALVGDSPNRELVVGSRLNGIPMQLSKGSGVVNAKSTNTLAGILNNLGSLGGNAVSNYSNNNSRSTSINIANLNVQTNNGRQLVDYLKSYGSQMTQEAYSY